jgi:hypothetical protein
MARMQPSVSLKIVIAIELILSAKLADEVVLSFTVMPVKCQICVSWGSSLELHIRLLMALEVLNASKGFVASWEVTCARCLFDDSEDAILVCLLR